MPYLKITTSKPIDAGQKHSLLEAASKMVASELGKSEQYMMASVESPVPMLFAGTDEPLPGKKFFSRFGSQKSLEFPSC